MSKVRELTIAEINLVSGGGHFGDIHDAQGVGTGSKNNGGARNTLGRNAPTHIYSDPSTVKCANSVFSGMIGGAIKGGVVGMARGTIGGAVTGQCLSGGSNGNGGGNNAGSSKCSGSNVGGTCNR
ncbi:TPA: hypothetical protein NPP35_004337 [Klebsiella variicola subsp. variicola]|nr:hypothetical protein [Klebsiella variicola subsp. variicola]